ncbi:hypothetical protein TNCV_841201 [Trichonephila clavipes]|nr:hypothetical protein TNCV_841201 [Trichonephila clavipes]
MFDSSSYDNPTPLAHADASRDVFPSGGTSQVKKNNGVRMIQKYPFHDVTPFATFGAMEFITASISQHSH